MMLFTEADKRTSRVPFEDQYDDQEETFTAVEYAANLDVVKDRLELMGFTLRAVREAFGLGVAERIQQLDRRPEGPSGTPHHELMRTFYENERRVLNGLSFDAWLEAFALICRRELQPGRNYWWDVDSTESDLPMTVRFLLGGDLNNGIWFPSYDGSSSK